MATPEEQRRLTLGPRNPRERIWFDRYSHPNLQRWRQVQDPLADACLASISFRRPSGLLDEVERRAVEQGGVYRDFLEHCHSVPAWVDFQAMDLGRRMYRRHGALQGLVLMCSSLVEGYAHNKPSQVLVATGRLQEDVSRRIYETGQMLHNIAAPEGLRPGGLGHRTLMEVRLLHAAVRRHLDDSGRWNSDLYDLPINQEDMAGTVLEFDYMVVRGLRRLGLYISRREHEAMHYFWRYAGYLLGVDEALLTATIEEQEILALQLTSHLYEPTADSEALAKALLRDMANKPPFHLPYDVLLAISRFLIGDAMADDLRIHNRVSSAAAVRMLRATLGVASLGQRLLPERAKRRLEDINHGLGRRTLNVGLGKTPARWGFKAMA
ncbi:oxygenase MpaB family protein [Alloalcanivorax mobilis]|uniref:oxygenase MpaB family protein n=1 Tax=Alloalcanivorax mobilis TaxID=2019569 RepID=UPI000C788B9F|nr:oxygenase MpaB family protein [Alloalcanivorax mobilis]